MINRILYVVDNVYYQSHGWLGCQLLSYEWKRQRAGSCRKLIISSTYSVEMQVFTTGNRNIKNCFKVPTTWAICSSGTLDEHTSRIKELFSQLNSL
jgi:hypothetical protein